MFNKLREFQIQSYCRATNFVEDFKKDERGLDGIVVTVILIMLALFIVAFLWDGLSELIEDWWSNISGSADTLEDF